MTIPSVKILIEKDDTRKILKKYKLGGNKNYFRIELVRKIVLLIFSMVISIWIIIDNLN